MAWTQIDDASLDQDSPVTTTLMTALRDNIRLLRTTIFGVYVAEATHTGDTTYTTIASVIVNLPTRADDSGVTRQIVATVEGKASTGTMYFRLVDNASGTTGSEGSRASTAYGDVTSTLSLGSLTGSRTINLQIKPSSAAYTAYLRSSGMRWAVTY